MANIKIISGMAMGWDMAIARACVKIGVPWIAAVPFKDQERTWAPATQEKYRELLGLSERVEVVNPGYWSVRKFLLRNEWMVDQVRNGVDIFAATGHRPGSLGGFQKVLLDGLNRFAIGVVQGLLDEMAEPGGAGTGGQVGSMLTLWNGKTEGGTATCVDYAQQHGVEVCNYWPQWIEWLREKR